MDRFSDISRVQCGRQHDQNEYASQLDHLGMSETAQEYVTTSSRSITTAISELDKTDFKGYQVQFVAKQVVYVYQRGTVASLPLDSGQWFSAGDFASSLPVTVVRQSILPINCILAVIISVICK